MEKNDKKNIRQFECQTSDFLRLFFFVCCSYCCKRTFYVSAFVLYCQIYYIGFKSCSDMWEKVHGINISKQQFVFNINVHLFKLLTGPLTLFLNQFFPKASIWNSLIGIHIIKFSLAVQKLYVILKKKNIQKNLFFILHILHHVVCV